jgi:hypothetical protein
VTQRLEVVAHTLQERDYEALIDNHEVCFRYLLWWGKLRACAVS